MQKDLDKLPQGAGIAIQTRTNSPFGVVSAHRVLPGPRIAKAAGPPMELVSALPAGQGYVLDYEEVETIEYFTTALFWS